MKRDLLMLFILIVVVLWVGFYFEGRFTQLKLAQESTAATVNSHEVRLNSLEHDFHRRQKLRTGVSKALAWLWGKVHF
jgi:hypothetical protein